MTLGAQRATRGDPEPFGLFIDGGWVDPCEWLVVRNPFDGERVARIGVGTAADVEVAVRAAESALAEAFPLHRRYDVLMRTADRIEAAQDEYAYAIAREGSKTIREAAIEPARAANIFRLSAEEGRRLAGETLPFDSRRGSENRVGYYVRCPAGVVAAITPFNDPLAMVAHKAGPALAAGNAVVLKPSSLTPLSALKVAADLSAAGLPPGRFNVVTGSGEEVGTTLVSHPAVRVVTFTGGVETGKRIVSAAGIKKVCMELGSNSPVIVMPDADLDRAVPAITAGAFAQAGQNCLGVQRVIVHRQVYDTFKERFVAHASTLQVGWALDSAVDVCAMITEAEAARVEAWIEEAIRGGARVLLGGRRDRAVVPPTVLEHVPRGARLDTDEAYGPVVSLYGVSSLEEAIETANAVPFGLHAAIFTENLRTAFAAAQRLQVGCVIVNDSTDYRLDIMPFGGTKMSGVGREGIRFAIEEMTETRVVCLNL